MPPGLAFGRFGLETGHAIDIVDGSRLHLKASSAGACSVLD